MNKPTPARVSVKRPDPDGAYGRLVTQAQRSLRDINQYLVDGHYWNTVVRPDKWPDHPPIELTRNDELEGWRRYLYDFLNLTVYYVACTNLQECGYTGEGRIDDPCPRCGALLVPDQREPI